MLALAVDPAGTLYAGGAFTQADGATANYMARWDGTTWAPLGSGMQGATSPYVYALAVDVAGDLVAGGAFTTAGGTAAPDIARWDGAAWSGLGTGLAGGRVHALAVTGMGEVLAGGSFTEAGRVATSRVARWSGGRWHALGEGVDGTVFAVTPAGVSGQIYAGGSFTSPRFFTRWNGVRWQAYGAGLACAAASCIPAGLACLALRVVISMWAGISTMPAGSPPTGLPGGTASVGARLAALLPVFILWRWTAPAISTSAAISPRP